ncbi:hypothetical protein GH714_028349 [Hevea brasiliensis]|uniref:RING-type domain-containing protein n=1 Tax=Hevea brasiliensis TaxID=3981 RepID=A0A6A6LEX1_HEVBR|nr:hypothetical protein GH714_028349 [Hevea brasiliensis]
MASETQLPGSSSAFERMLRHRDLSLFLPFFLGFAGTATQSDPGQETPQTATPHERIILINPFTQGMVVIEGSESLDSLLRELATKNGQPPASKASIGAMPTVEIAEIGDKEGECAICLEEWELGGYKMPVDEVDLGKKREEEEEGRERRRLEREIWVSFSFNSNRRSEDSNQPSSNSNDVFSSSPGLDQETEG